MRLMGRVVVVLLAGGFAAWSGSGQKEFSGAGSTENHRYRHIKEGVGQQYDAGGAECAGKD
jgi:hypothetical protein